jgi:hypothetical protein
LPQRAVLRIAELGGLSGTARPARIGHIDCERRTALAQDGNNPAAWLLALLKRVVLRASLLL